MRDVLMLVCVLVALYLGHFPVRRLDRFLERNAERTGGAAAGAPFGERSGRARLMENLTHLWYIGASGAKERWKDDGRGELRRRA